MKYILTILMFCYFSSACQRRELDYNYNDNLDVLIVPDWSQLQTGAEVPLYLKACFYPVDGGKMLERYIDPDGETIKIPPGKYNVIVYTWRINANAQTVQFRSTERFETLEAYTAETSNSKNEQYTTQIIMQPDDYMYSWSSLSTPVSITKSGLQSISKDENKQVVCINTTMKNRVKRYKIRIRIENHMSIASIEAHITGSTGWYRLADGSMSPDHFSINVEPSLAETKNDNSAIVDFSFNTFGILLSNTRYSDSLTGNIRLVIKTVNGNNLTQEVTIDLTENIISIENGDKEEIDQEDHPPIVVEPSTPPEGGGGGFNPPEIGDWEDGGSIDLGSS